MSTLASSAVVAGTTDRLGYLDQVTPADPAAGANLTVDFLKSGYIVPVAVTFTLTTSAVAGNRFVAVDYLARGGLAAMRNAATVLVTASTTAQVFQFDNQHTVSEWNTSTPVYAPLLPLPLGPGWLLRVTVDSIDAGDQLNSVKVLFIRTFNSDQD